MRLNMADTNAYYVSLGDSMSIDAYAGGPGCGAPSLLLRNREEDFPEWRGRDLTTTLPGARLIPLAMDGGTSSTVRYAQIPRLREMNIRPSLVTLTMGGNDLLQSLGSDTAAQAAHRALEENGRAILTALRDLCGPGVPILLGTVYDPSDGTGDTARLQIMAWPTALEWIGRFNDTLRALADEHGATVADIHGAFLGHGLHVGSPAQPDPRPANRDLYYCGVIEPNAWGASALRALWWRLLVERGVVAESTAR
jgi:lysophospholipase L1-like esterase